MVGQTELAGKLGVTPQAWSGWEMGRSEPALDTIKRIAKLLEVDAGWLAFGTTDRGRTRSEGNGGAAGQKGA